jgi:arginyl-tRNA synthetase
MMYLTELLTTACEELFNLTIEPVLTRPDEQFGDYATNVALQLAGKLERKPRDIAEELQKYLEANHDGSITSVEVAGPGFLNITVTDATLWRLTQRTPQQTLAGKLVVAEYSDPNPFKVLHAGHLYTSLVGDTVAKVLEAAGAEVKRVNFGGDVGMHVARAMWGIIQELSGEFPEKLSDIAEQERADWISARYVEGNTAFEDDEAARQEITDLNARIYDIHTSDDHESPFAQIYWTCRQWSYDGFDVLYKALNMVPFDKYYPESETTPPGIATVEEGLARGVFEKSDGAVVFDGESQGLHTRVFLNSKGLPTYEAKDLGLARRKWEDYQFDLSIMITGNDIVEYMKVVLLALSNFYPEVVERTRHLTHGMVKMVGGVKMSSRKGNILRAKDILEAAHKAAEQSGRVVTEGTVLAAVRYAFLKNRIGGDVVYDPVESVALEGNSGPYLQYAHARAHSILAKKAAIDGEPGDLETGERSLVRKLGMYSEAVDQAVEDMMPHHICTYLYELSQVFNRFYEKNRVIDDEREAVRLKLVKAYADTLKHGLELLNIQAPEKM